MDRRRFLETASAGAAALAATKALATQAEPLDSNVLRDVPMVQFTKTACLCFVGSTGSVMRYLGEDVTDDYLMGISGGALTIFWGVPWCDCNCDILYLGDEPIDRIFAALGYEHTRFREPNRKDPGDAEERFGKAIVESIDKGRPVIAQGPVGPPEASVIAGYQDEGRVLRGWSYFQEEFAIYFRAEEWFPKGIGLIVIGDKKETPSREQVLKGTLEWAIALAKVEERFSPQPPEGDEGQRLIAGLAAFDAFAEALEKDESFPEGDLETLTSRLVPIGNDGIHLMGCKRDAAVRFLTSVAEWDLPGADDVKSAADAYSAGAFLWKQAGASTPWTGAPEAKRLEIADRALRTKLAGLIRDAKVHEARAVSFLEVALGKLTTDA